MVSERPPDRPETRSPDATPDTYRMTFDSAEVDPSVAVVEAIAHVEETDPMDLEALHHYVDTDSLDGLCSRPTPRPLHGDCRIEFTYLGYVVRVKSYGLVEVEPVSVESG